MRRTKILTSKEMARIEKLAIEEKGAKEAESYMEEVGLQLAQKVEQFLEK